LNIGVDFATVLGDPGADGSTTLLTGDMHSVVPNILAPINPITPWEFSIALGVETSVMACDFDGYLSLDPTGYPISVDVVEPSEFTLILTGKPGYPVEIYGGAGLFYDLVTDQWLFEPIFGIGVYFELE